jgi:hypothetical protein
MDRATKIKGIAEIIQGHGVCADSTAEKVLAFMDEANQARPILHKMTLLDYGYAPGDYQNTCVHCSKKFIGAKRAVSCKPCAEFYLGNDKENYDV